MVIRPATIHDVDELVPLWLTFIASGRYPLLERATPAQLRRLLIDLLALHSAACCLVAEDRTGLLVGGLALVEDPGTDDPYIDEVLWGVVPGFEMTLAAAQLFTAGEAWVATRRVRWFQVSCPVGSASIDRFYQGRGFLPASTTYLKELR